MPYTQVHTDTAVHTHHHKHTRTWHVVQPGAGDSAQTRQPFLLDFNDTASAQRGICSLGSEQAGAKAVGGAMLSES